MELVSRLTRLSAATETSHAMTSAPIECFSLLRYQHDRNIAFIARTHLVLFDFFHSLIAFGHLCSCYEGLQLALSLRSAQPCTRYILATPQMPTYSYDLVLLPEPCPVSDASRSSMATPRPVSVALATILFAIVWLVFALNRLSRPEIAFSFRLAFNGRLPPRFCFVAFR